MVIVSLSLALICFAGECHNALVGKKTPIGTYTLQQRITDDKGYGGDVLQFHEVVDTVYAIHRVWLLNPAQKRTERITGNDPHKRVITAGCINVTVPVYEKLVDCCSTDELIVIQ